MYYFGAFILFCIGIAHSYLGERYILIKLFERPDLPKLYGSSEFTKNTLRFAWHLTTIAWWGFAVILLHLASSYVSKQFIGNVIGATFLIHFLIALLGSKAKHFSWYFFLLVSGLVIYASNT